MPRSSKTSQENLFGAEEDPLFVAIDPTARELAAQLPALLRLGTMSWAFPGWRGLLYGRDVDPKRLARDGLVAYAKHPLFRTAEIDRSYYEPLSTDQYREFASQVPEDFRFVVKAHQDCTVDRFPQHARYGSKRGLDNPRFLDPAYAGDVVIAPMMDTLGSKLGAILFQFSPEGFGAPQLFASRLRSFLSRLPTGVTYAIELRNRALLTREYAAALKETGTVHCHNLWSDMPPLLQQARQLPPELRRPLIIRWLLRPGDTYASASARFAPFDRIVDEDPTRRDVVARLVVRALQHDVPAFVLVNNDAEGCAPQTIQRLARAIRDLQSA